MKLLLAVVNQDDADGLFDELLREHFRATVFQSSGIFLGEPNVTLMAGCEDDQVDRLLEIIRANCHSRQRNIESPPRANMPVTLPYPVEITVGGALIFVFDVERYESC